MRLYFSPITTHPSPLHHHQPGRNYNLIPLDYFIKPDILSLALIYSDPNVVVPLVSTTHVHCTPVHCAVAFRVVQKSLHNVVGALRCVVVQWSPISNYHKFPLP